MARIKFVTRKTSPPKTPTPEPIAEPDNGANEEQRQSSLSPNTVGDDHESFLILPELAPTAISEHADSPTPAETTRSQPARAKKSECPYPITLP